MAKFSEENAKKAKEWVEHVCSTYSTEIVSSIGNSAIERNFNESRIRGIVKRFDKTNVYVTKNTVEEQILECAEDNKRICVLNFASYKGAGGAFMQGAMAQEEALCHVSTLYPVLSKFSAEYTSRLDKLNNGLYGENFIYSPDIVFEINGTATKADVLTYAAPNMMRKAKTDEYYSVFKKRMIYAYTYPYLRGADALILGAWGCGVFCNDPNFVASFWDLCSTILDGFYTDVYHPVPTIGKSGSKNYNAFNMNINHNRM
jgi:uncharacterized protein (TIGR02452 family)